MKVVLVLFSCICVAKMVSIPRVLRSSDRSYVMDRGMMMGLGKRSPGWPVYEVKRGRVIKSYPMYKEDTGFIMGLGKRSSAGQPSQVGETADFLNWAPEYNEDTAALIQYNNMLQHTNGLAGKQDQLYEPY